MNDTAYAGGVSMSGPERPLMIIRGRPLRMIVTPSVLREGPYRFYFYSHEHDEPPHVHVDRDERTAKFWIQPVALALNLGFRSIELRRIEAIVSAHQLELLEAWNEYFGT